MAYMTKAEKLAALQQRCDAFEAKREATYLPRLMAALELATSGMLAMELTVESGVFKLSERAKRGQVFMLPASYVKPDMFDKMQLDDLESFLNEQEEKELLNLQ
jgi:hypothetical protein